MQGLNKYFKIIPDKMYLKLKYRLLFGRNLDFDNPKSFNEKINFLKIYDKNPIYTKMVDKSEAKKYAANIIGEKYIIPTIGVYEKFDDIDFDSLPDRFVIKCTHDSGGLVICKDKKSFDKEVAKKKINKCLKTNYYYHGREWPYKNVKPRILIEDYMEDSKCGELRDYKFFCFDGVPKLMFVATNRFGDGETYFDFFDEDYNHLPFSQGHPNAPVIPRKPKNFEKMKKLASKLSQGIKQVRIDFYEVDGEVYFGEFTFSHFSGMMPFVPDEWDYKIGELVKLKEDVI